MAINNFNVGVGTTSQLTRYRYVATGGETSISGADADSKTLSYTVGLEQVFLNGVNLVRGQDYTATNGTTISNLTALVASDSLEVFAYVPFNIANAVTASTVDAKGDLLVGTAADTVGRLAVGSNDAVLTAASGETTGLKWNVPNNYNLINSGGTTLTGAATITVSNISGYSKIFAYTTQASSANASAGLGFRFNGDTGGNYPQVRVGMNQGTTPTSSDALTGDYVWVASMESNASSYFVGFIHLFGCNSTSIKPFNAIGFGSGGSGQRSFCTQGHYTGTSTISSVSVFSTSGNFDAGTLYVYGAI